jgi:hypothetical protein
MKSVFGWNPNWLHASSLAFAGLAGSFVANPLRADEDPPVTKKSTVVVVSSDDGKADEVVAKVREQLEKSGLPKEQQEKILEQVQSAIANADKSKGIALHAQIHAEHIADKAEQEAKRADELVKDEGVHAERIARGIKNRTIVMKQLQDKGDKANEQGKVATKQRIIIIDKDGKQQEINLGEGGGINLDGSVLLERLGQLQKLEGGNAAQGEMIARLPEMLQGRVLQFAGDGPAFRIGIAINRSTEEENEEDETEGLVVEDVMPDSPALKAGIKKGDIVVTVNGEELEDFVTLQEAVQKAGKDDSAIKLEIKREGKEMTVTVKPTKTEASDVGTMNIKLAPENGFIVTPGQGVPQGIPQGMAWAFKTANGDEQESLKKEIHDLKSDVEELKGLIKKLIDKDK